MKVNGFNVEHDLQAAITVYDRMFLKERKVQFAMAAALTKTGQDVKARLEREVNSVFDRPKLVTQRGLFLIPATKANLQAEVLFKDKGGNRLVGNRAITSAVDVARYMEPQISGGGRDLKRFEKVLQSSGLLPQGMAAVPGQEAKIDSYGNMSNGQLRQIMSHLRLQAKAGYESRLSSDSKKAARAIKRAGGLFFYAEIGGTKGIWQREPGRRGPKPILIFVREPNYKPRLAFRRISEETARQKIHGHMRTAILKEHEDAAQYAASKR